MTKKLLTKLLKKVHCKKTACRVGKERRVQFFAPISKFIRICFVRKSAKFDLRNWWERYRFSHPTEDLFKQIKNSQKGVFYLPKAGLEPARGCPHKILSLARLPISSLRLIQLSLYYNNRNILNFKYYFKKIFIKLV